jgi:putative transposase
VKRRYHTIEKNGKVSAGKLAKFLCKNGQFLIPLVELIEQCRLACDELIEVTGRAALQAVLQLSSQQVAGGPPHSGRRRAGEVVWHGRQPGWVMLSDRKLAIERPRLRQRGTGENKEVEIPAYAALQNEPRLRARMLEILMRGVSTRN